MITIPTRQQTEIGNEIFIEKAVKHLREHYSNFALLEKKEARNFVIVNRNISINLYGFNTEKAVMTYILVAWEIGADFHKKTEFNNILLNSTKIDSDRSFDLYCAVYKKLKTSDNGTVDS